MINLIVHNNEAEALAKCLGNMDRVIEDKLGLTQEEGDLVTMVYDGLMNILEEQKDDTV